MSRLSCVSVILIALGLAVIADNKVVSVDTNGVLNVDSFYVGSATTDVLRADGVVLGTSKVDETGVTFSGNDGVIVFAWPTNYVSEFGQQYPAYGVNTYTDPFATEWFVGKSITDLRNFFIVIGDEHFYEEYTNNPPTTLHELEGYVSDCVYLLSHVRVEKSYDDVTNEMARLDARVSATENTSKRFGGGVNDLDFIINSDIESDNMDASDMLEMIKTMARYIKNGTTNQLK